MKDFELKGIKDVVGNINKELEQIKIRSTKGLILAAALIRRDMEKTPPIVPRDTGNLDASWFTELIDGKHGPGLLMGFSANYAVFVHENMEPTVKWNRPGSGPKFFEAALNRNTTEIIKIIRDNAHVK